MSILARAPSKAPLLKAFLSAAVLLVLLMGLFALVMWQYTASILAREAALVTTVLPDLEVIQRLTGATSALQAEGLLLRTSGTLEELEVRRVSLNGALVLAERIVDTQHSSISSYKGALRVLLADLKNATGQLSEVKAQELLLVLKIQKDQAELSNDLLELVELIESRIVLLTDLLMAGIDSLNAFEEAPWDDLGVDYQNTVATFETYSLRIQDYLLLNQEALSLQGLVERVPLLTAYSDILIAQQERDLLLRSMVNRVIYASDDKTQRGLLVPLTDIHRKLRGKKTLFSERASLLELAETQIIQSEQLAETIEDVIELAGVIRSETDTNLVETSIDTLNKIVRYRWFLVSLLVLVVAILCLTSYWLLYRRTVVPLVTITDQLEKVGTAEFVALKSSYFLEEMDELATAVKELDRAQKSMREQDKQLERRNSELALANEDLQQFAHVASHDLQEPLRKLQQFSGLLQEEYGESLDEDGGFYVRAIASSSKRMSLMIRDTLEYARTSRAGQLLRPVDLHQVIDVLLGDLDLLIKDSGATINVDPLPILIANNNGVSQLLRNLLVNSMKYKREGVACQITIRQRPGVESQNFIIEFEDNGIGIKKEHLNRIFIPFERLAISKVSGTGLGLSICQKVCDAHSWKISVDSSVGRGMCFSIHIPVSHQA